MENDMVLDVENVIKTYDAGRVGSGSLQKSFERFFAKLTHRPDPTAPVGVRIHGDKVIALNGVSFAAQRGERIGILGKNGSGKSTLLKLISGITLPTDGQITVKGKVSSLLEVGTGFHSELTGRENIYLNGAILGMSKKEIDEKLPQILAFSGCEEFIDVPVKRYSSGMVVRLAFSVVVYLKNDILILDEVLTVSDRSFWKKSLDKLKQNAVEENKTVLCVSHNMETIQSLCYRSIVLEQGKIIFDGPTEEAIPVYLESCKK